MNRVLEVLARHRRWAVASIAAELTIAAALVVSAGGHASGLPPLPTNDMQRLLALTGYPTPAQAPVQHNPEPKLAPVPRSACRPRSRPLPGDQARLPTSAI